MEEIILEEGSQQSMDLLVDLQLQGSQWTIEVSEVQYLWPHRDKLLCDILLIWCVLMIQYPKTRN
jgi:hypothetical protein